MSLAKFIQSLQEEEVIYSEPVKSSIRVIPPEKQQSTIRVLPPETSNDAKVESHVSKPIDDINSSASTTKIKLKLNKKPVDVNSQPASVLSEIPKQPKSEVKPSITTDIKSETVVTPNESTKIVSQKVSNTESKPQSEPIIEHQEPIENTIKDEPIVSRELTDEEIFNSTGTEYSKMSIWMEYFQKAKNSRKKNPIVDRMKVGRFTITPDNKVLLLPDYDIVGKDPDDVLKDKWF